MCSHCIERFGASAARPYTAVYPGASADADVAYCLTIGQVSADPADIARNYSSDSETDYEGDRVWAQYVEAEEAAGMADGGYALGRERWWLASPPVVTVGWCREG